ncbi:DUF4304 domain-containing protein [Streptomyces sp. AC495_CC817]|uniref:DUF4304 domain-containing protein n=1 Tax=Streptomyces sp. AC495_CC817 TaxID=2823900 RepID=UPI001C26C2CE|nr:DUF4304 domain-containing protein [Streptomyces sp. AC495_CC817]
MDRKTVTAQLRTQFFPVLAAAGFSRSGDVLRRELAGPVVHVVEVQHRARSGVFQVNLGAHLPALGGVAGGATVAVERMREYDCAWRSSVLSGFRNASDSEFAYGATEEQASESVAFLLSEWERQGPAFFDPLADFPDGFRERARASVSTPLHPAHLLTWAKVADLLGEGDLRRDIVEAALPRVPERATALRDDLLALR